MPGNLITLLITLAAVLAGCATTTPITGAQRSSLKNVAVLSLLSEQVSGSRVEGIMQAYPPAVAVPWRINDVLRSDIAETLRAGGIGLIDVSQTPQPHPGTIPQHEADMVRDVSAAAAQPATRQPVDAVIVVHPVALNRYGQPNSAIHAAGTLLTFGFLGALSLATEEFRPGFLVMLPSEFSQALGEAKRCSIGYSLYVVDPKSRTVLASRTSQITRAPISRPIWPATYDTLAEADRTSLESECMSPLRNSVRGDVAALLGITGP